MLTTALTVRGARRPLGYLVSLTAALVVAFTLAAAAAPAYGSELSYFCRGYREAHASCYGKFSNPGGYAINQSTDGGWSWVWEYNEKSGAALGECKKGNCIAVAYLAEFGKGSEEMANISGSTYFYEPLIEHI